MATVEFLKTPAIASYLRNFIGEKHRLQEIMEITMCYGILCLSRNFAMKGITVDELKTITKHKDTQRRDFFIRKLSPSAKTNQMNTPIITPTFYKAPHTWRDGVAPESIISPTVREVPTITHEDRDSNYHEVAARLGKEDNQKYVDELELFTQLFGDTFIDTVWLAYNGKPGLKLELSSSACQQRFLRVDQRKQLHMFNKFIQLENAPRTTIIHSFQDFLAAYVVRCVSHYAAMNNDDTLMSDFQESSPLENGKKLKRNDVQNSNVAEALTVQTSPHSNEPKRLHSTKPKKETKNLSNRALTSKVDKYSHIHSKIASDVQAQRSKALRVKKTQAQRMKEALARSRLKAYDEKESNGIKNLNNRPVSLKSISNGAAALEIADNFITSPLLENFTKITERSNEEHDLPPDDTPYRTELYGPAVTKLDDIGCHVPKSTHHPSSKNIRHNYNNWLGEYGPQHTHTVQPSWEGDEIGVDGYEPVLAKTSNYEWTLGESNRPSKLMKKKPITTSKFSDDDWSDSLEGYDSDKSDSFLRSSIANSTPSDEVFRWLKDHDKE